MIGSCSRMQTLSLEDEIRRMDGVPYTIDFYQDFSTDILEEVDNMESIPKIIKEIMNPRLIDVRQQNNNVYLEERRRSEEFWSNLHKMEKKEAKRVKKWKKHHKKVSTKQALKNFNCIYKEMTGG